MRARTKVWYVLCSTQGKKVEFGYLGSINYTEGHVYLVDVKGEPAGHNPLEHCFFTRQQAVDDWRRRAAAESTEHAQILELAAELLREGAEKIRENALPQGDWRDL